MAKAIQSSFGELSILTAGAGMLVRAIPGIGNAEIISAACLGIATLCGMVYVSRKSKFDVLFRNLKLGIDDVAYPIFKRKTRKAGYMLYEFTIPAGLCLNDFLKAQSAIETYLGAAVEIESGFKNLFIKVYENERTEYTYEPYRPKDETEIVIGYDRTGQLNTLRMNDGKPHLMIGGESGGGKSTAMRSIITNMILFNPVDIYLADLKGSEFKMFRNCKKIIGYADNKDDTANMLHAFKKEMERRYQLISDADCVDIKEYNHVHQKSKLTYQIFIIDELSILMEDKDAEKCLEVISALGRAAGQFLILSTQRPDAKKVMNGRIKANISNILALKTHDDTNSRVILGHSGAENLRGDGHGIFRQGAYEIFVQCPNLKPEKAKELIAPYIVKKEEKMPDAPKLISFDFLDAV